MARVLCLYRANKVESGVEGDMKESNMSDKICESKNDPFEHLQELIDTLPALQKKGERLARARAARAVVAADHRHQIARKDLETLDAQLESATCLAEQARTEKRSAQEIERFERDRLYFAALRGYRVGPEQNAAREVEQALQAGGFPDVDTARAALLPADEFDALAAEVEAYQTDYAETLAICKAVDTD